MVWTFRAYPPNFLVRTGDDLLWGDAAILLRMPFGGYIRKGDLSGTLAFVCVMEPLGSSDVTGYHRSKYGASSRQWHQGRVKRVGRKAALSQSCGKVIKYISADLLAISMQFKYNLFTLYLGLWRNPKDISGRQNAPSFQQDASG